MLKVNLLKRFVCSLFFGSCCFLKAQSSAREVSFSIQDSRLTWFLVADPRTQGQLDIGGLPNGIHSNSLAYDNNKNRLIFVDGDALSSHSMYSIGLTGMTLGTGSAFVTASQIDSFGSSGAQQFLGGSFYNGCYYALENGGDTLFKITFGADGKFASKKEINLPVTNTMYLGDIAFDIAIPLYS